MWGTFPDDVLCQVVRHIHVRKRGATGMACRQGRRVMRLALGEELELVPEQVNCFLDVMSGENVFITGSAGVGKSHLLKAIIRFLPSKGLAITASTGCAAAVIGASTFHSSFSRNLERMPHANSAVSPNWLGLG